MGGGGPMAVGQPQTLLTWVQNSIPPLTLIMNVGATFDFSGPHSPHL